MGMEILCCDLEGVFVPEIWINVAEATGIDDLRLTTRDVPDYDELMAYRLRILDEHGLGIAEISQVISTLRPLDGAVEFLRWAQDHFQVVILSDTFYDFAAPLMAQLGQPMLLCHNLVINDAGRITGYRLRLDDQKRRGVEAFRSLNFSVFAVGDSYNDTAMLVAADQGFLFNPPAKVAEQFPQLPTVTSYDDLREHLTAASSRVLV
ncbi:MAG: bifunctional phosphoserine phosphatase/homoserine phosphotransferase ThrH [Propionibacteriaceae bacterium]|jgi:phosphoserine/homoserine phosphotransferase|nr:bifunctional phosphoserine phosphatase/homoserine phosphotransferase ThrH [Propionibacteriaceae bacterium]